MPPPFHPRHAFVTGAAGAIGGMLVRALAARSPATRFSLVDRDAHPLGAAAASLGDRAAAIPWDLARISTLHDLWQNASAQFGPIDLLVNCAGFMEIRSLSATPWDTAAALLDVDLVAPLRLLHLAAAEMTPGAAVVNISSMAGVVPLRGCSFYGAAKSGLAMASEIAALELAPRGIHVVTVYPGAVRSKLEARARAQVPSSFVSRNVPTGDPGELAAAIVRALESGRTRVVYPRFYAWAHAFSGLGRWVTSALSPTPRDDA